MKKIVSLLLIVAMIATCMFAFTACSDKADESKEKTETSKEAEETKENGEEPKKEASSAGKEYEDKDGVFKMGTNAAFPPYEYKEGEEFKGIDIEIAQAIATELGLELEIVDMEFESIITSVQEGEVDVGIAGMTVSDERKEQVNFTSSYATGVQVVIVKEDSAISSIDDLEGKKIGTQLGTTGDIYSKDDYGEENVTSYSKGADAVIALKGGDVDAVIIDNEPAKAFVAENEGLKILETEYAIEDYAIAVSKDNVELLDDINEALKKLTKDGTIDGIISKYISAE